MLWGRIPDDDYTEEEINYDEIRFELRSDYVLVIDDVRIDDSGVYTCYEHMQYEAVHHLQVMDAEILTKVCVIESITVATLIYA